MGSDRSDQQLTSPLVEVGFVYLASRSPRRRELLDQIGVSYSVVDVEVDESVAVSESPVAAVGRLATDKARAAVAKLRTPDFPVLAADTLVVCRGEVFGKPEDRAHAADMLRALADGEHQVLTALTLADGARELRAISRTTVTFGPIPEPRVAAYWVTGEPCDKAGGYAIQGLGAQFVSRLEGSYSGVMGLPLYETVGLLNVWASGAGPG
jgi:septum formation protein